MALVLSLNCINYREPLSHRNPNFKISSPQSTVQCPNHHPPFTSSLCQRQRRRLRLVNSLDQDLSESDSLARLDDEEENNLGVKAALSMLRFYKREISPLLPNSCRYVPTCSEYSMIAYKKYGVVKGTILTAWRLCRCNPLGGSGFDPPRWFNETNPTEQ